MIELVEYIAKSLVDFPDAVKVSSRQNGNQLDIMLEVDESDMGKIIGRQGRIAKAIRSILKAISLKDNVRVNLKINEK